MIRSPETQERRNSVKTLERSPQEIGASFKDYADRLLDSFSLHNANFNRTLEMMGQARVVDFRFINRFAAHMLHYLDPAVSARTSDLQVPFVVWGNEVERVLEEDIEYDTAARKAFDLVVEDSRTKGTHDKLLRDLQKVQNGKHVDLPPSNTPSVGWEIRRIYKETRERLDRREKS